MGCTWCKDEKTEAELKKEKEDAEAKKAGKCYYH